MASQKSLMWEHLSKFQELKEVRVACDRLMKKSMVDKQVVGQIRFHSFKNPSPPPSSPGKSRPTSLYKAVSEELLGSMGRTLNSGRWSGRHPARGEPVSGLLPVPLNGVSGPPYVNFVNSAKNEKGEAMVRVVLETSTEVAEFLDMLMEHHGSDHPESISVVEFKNYFIEPEMTGYPFFKIDVMYFGVPGEVQVHLAGLYAQYYAHCSVLSYFPSGVSEEMLHLADQIIGRSPRSEDLYLSVLSGKNRARVKALQELASKDMLNDPFTFLAASKRLYDIVKTSGERQEVVFQEQFELGEAYQESDMHDDAVKCLLPALRGLEKLGHELTVDVMAALSTSYFALGRGGEGVQLLETAYEAQKAMSGSTHPETEKLYARLKAARRRLLSVTLKLDSSDDKDRAGGQPMEPLSRAVRSSLRRENKKLAEENERLRQEIARREENVRETQVKIKQVFIFGASMAAD
mmetsp:Transcript_23834/g.49589  ORF Transcript_23834/g.49589 Transcript_23834/m.49589 type:complete len:462 (-) Transcript_23834:20-1405(-)